MAKARKGAERRRSPSDLMHEAVALAARARGRTAPNPMVGSLVVRGGRVIARGFHRRAGLAHAEADALARAGAHARGATLYVTLEPCAHHGRTPPCVDAVLASGVRKVVIGVLDPEPNLPEPVRGLYLAWIRAAYLVAEMENALRIDHGPRPPESSVTPLALRHRSDIHDRFRFTYFDAVTGEIADGLWRRTLAAYRLPGDPEWIRDRMERVRQGAGHAGAIRAAHALAAEVRALGATAGAGAIVWREVRR